MEEHKSERLKQTALQNSWKAEIIPNLDKYERTGNPFDVEWHFYAKREKETIHVQYTGDRFTASTYKYGDYVSNPARSGAVIKLLTGRPDPRKLGGSDSESLLANRYIPWEKDAPAIDILRSVLGKTITWVRKLDGEIDSAYVDRETNLGKKYFRLYESKAGRRILEWQDRQGFHAVCVDQIIDVS